MNRSIFLVSCHVPGKENIQADSLSRNLAHETEEMLDRAVLCISWKGLNPYIFHVYVKVLYRTEN